MTLLLAAFGLAAAAVVGWRQIRRRAVHALPALGIGIGISVVLLAYPAWYGLHGPQSVSGVLFPLAPLVGVPLTGFLSPGAYSVAAGQFVRFGGYLGHNGPPADYVGPGTAVLVVAAAVLARRRPLTWMLVFMTVMTIWLALGDVVIGAPHALAGTVAHLPLPWATLSKFPVLKEILSDQFSPFIMLFPAVLIGLGVDASIVRFRSSRFATRWSAGRMLALAAAIPVFVVVVALAPVWSTIDVPLTVQPVQVPAYMDQVAPKLPAGTVLLTVPFAVTGSTRPMLWQAVDDMHFHLAGAALKTPNARGRTGGRGRAGLGAADPRRSQPQRRPDLPAGTPEQAATVRRALTQWEVGEVVVTGTSADPVYASGFLTSVLGRAPVFVKGAWVWTIRPGSLSTPPAIVRSLPACAAAASAPGLRRDPLAMSRCVLFSAGRT